MLTGEGRGLQAGIGRKGNEGKVRGIGMEERDGDRGIDRGMEGN
jgi:hypothetical protein